MIQITPQMRVLVAIEPVDGRNYAPSPVTRSCFEGSCDVPLPIRPWLFVRGTELRIT